MNLTPEQQKAYDNFDWSSTTFEGAEREHLKRGMKSSFMETLLWLEESAARCAMFKQAREQESRKPSQ